MVLAAHERLQSLDVFRGLTIAAMILVNDPGSWQHIYGPLEHAPWNGWTHTDLVFPFFLFIAGVSMAFSFGKRQERGDSRAQLLQHTLRRGALIVLIGLLLHWFPFKWDKLFHLRYAGVLQRIGVVYAVGGAIYLFCGRRARIAVTAALLIGYFLLMKFVPFPGHTPGDLSPDGNLGAFIDRAVMGSHLWAQSKTWDPEGILSTVPAIGTLLIGTFAGELLRSAAEWRQKVKWLAIGGVAGIALGYAWHPWFPINKNLWTSSYVLFTAGYAMLALAACYWLIDVKRWRGWTMPVLVLGMNAITAFALSVLLVKILAMIRVNDAGLQSFVYDRWFVPRFADPRNASLAYALAFLLVCWLLMWPLWKRKIFLKL